MSDLKAADYLIAGCTLIGPLLAVQAQKYLERWQEQKARRRGIFRIMMSTRAARVSPQHVEAFNAIPIEFYGKKAIMDAWAEYFQSLSMEPDPNNPGISFMKRDGLFIALLHALARQLNYRFNTVEISQIYYPNKHVDIERENEELRRGCLAILEGKLAVPMAVKDFPFSQEATDLQMAANKAIVTLAHHLTAKS